MMSEENKAVEKLTQNFPDQILEVVEALGETTVSVKRDQIAAMMKFLKEDPELKFEVLMDLFGVDYLEMGGFERFAVVYHLYSDTFNKRLRIKAFVPEGDETIDSVTHLWAAANWPEREVFDMYGISFNNHPDLRRLLCPDNFEGFPLRKDFPLEGIGYRESFHKVTRENAQ
jgi:NADH-quinone oxidoreductase subunit C